MFSTQYDHCDYLTFNELHSISTILIPLCPQPVMIYENSGTDTQIYQIQRENIWQIPKLTKLRGQQQPILKSCGAVLCWNDYRIDLLYPIFHCLLLLTNYLFNAIKKEG